MNTNQTNPYIGPRTFLKEERHLFFGRDREARDLTALVITEKLVLFYAQSGAGKSSLINTHLIPELEQNLYEVLPVARLSGDSQGVSVDNIYIYNLMRSLMRRGINPTSLARLSLSQFLGRLNEDEDGYYYDDDLPTALRGNANTANWRRALIVDQFEELFTTHQEEWENRELFFRQLAQAMQDDPYLWVVLVMREDYIAALDPYAHLLPGGLRTRYYMQRLEEDQAIEAVEGPAKRFNRSYAPGAAKTLVNALSQVNVRGQNNQWETRSGQYVEPVQLQVVCTSLWEKSYDEGDQISNSFVTKHVEDINQALGNFYQERVEAVANGKTAQTNGVKEREIREWFEKQLIINGKRRNMVAQQPDGKSGGLDDGVVQEFLGTLVREEKRSGGATFYELTHDRMVEPVIENNRKWLEDNLNRFQRQAISWRDHGRNKSWLLLDEALIEMQQWAKKQDKLNETEEEFLKASEEEQAQLQTKAQQQADEARRQAREAQRLRRIAVVITMLAAVAFIAAALAFQSSRAARAAEADAIEKSNLAQLAQSLAENSEKAAKRAQQQAEEARSDAQLQADKALAGYLASQANLEASSDYPLALLMSVEAHERDDTLLTRTTLFNLLQTTPYQSNYDFNGAVTSVAVSPDGKWIATASCSLNELDSQRCTKGGFKIFEAGNLKDGKEPPASSRFGIVYSMVFFEQENELILATGGCVPQGCSEDKGQISFWRIAEDGTPDLVIQFGSEHLGLVKTLAFNATRTLLASGSYDTFAFLWSVNDLTKPRLVGKLDHDSFVNSVAFNSDGTSLASAGDDRTVYLWDISTISNELQQLPPPNKYEDQHKAPVTSVAFSPDDSKLASASDDRSILLWDFKPTSHALEHPIRLEGHTGYIKSIAFNADGSMLASAGFDNKIILWDTNEADQIEQIGPSLTVHSAAINGIAFGVNPEAGENDQFLISVSDDRSAIQWDLTSRNPVNRTFRWGSSSVPASDDKLFHTENGQQISLLYKTNNDPFLVISGFNSRVRVLGLNESTLITTEQNQPGSDLNAETTIDPNIWVTEWFIDPDNWVERACKAIGLSKTPQQIEQYRVSIPDLQNACK